ncbi:MAG: hypothetical protein HY804_07615 [Nitrospinae bacterium]|nr:hypothetical protein [Nitrospinota bacterium]
MYHEKRYPVIVRLTLPQIERMAREIRAGRLVEFLAKVFENPIAEDLSEERNNER